MKRLLHVVLGSCLFLFASACSSDDSDDHDDDDPTHAEQASCTFPGDDGSTCVDYRGDSAFVDVLRSSCMQSADGILAEGELCPTVGVSGICSDEGDDRSRLFYYNVTDGLDVLGEACMSGGGTWSTG